MHPGEIVFTGNEPSRIGSHPGPVGDEVGVAGTFYGQAREVENRWFLSHKSARSSAAPPPGRSTT